MTPFAGSVRQVSQRWDPAPDSAEIEAATSRLLATAKTLSDAEVLAPSGLPGWSRGHVLTHIARNADSLVNLLTWAATGVEHPQYPSMQARDTAIEAGAVACVWAFFVTMFIYRDYRWRDLPILVHRTLKTVAMVMTLIACASAVGYVMALMQIPAKVTAFFLTLSSDKNVILMMINVLLLILGCLIDMAPSILICTPILLPVVTSFGVDPVHFGMIMMLNLGIGLCHPPVGAILFVGCAVGKVTIEQVMRKIWPFYGVMFFVLMLVTYLPEVSLWLPRHVLR